jgi:hypothetical protein
MLVYYRCKLIAAQQIRRTDCFLNYISLSVYGIENVLFNSIPLSVCIWNREYIYIFFNKMYMAPKMYF